MFWHLSVYLSTLSGRGGSQVQVQIGGVPDLRSLGGSQVSDFQGGSQVSDFRGGGVPGLSKGKNFWHQIWLDTCSDWKNFFVEGPPPPPSKGKNFWHQIWPQYMFRLEKFFCRGTPSPPPVKGKIFDTRFGLIHVQTGKKFFVEGPPPQ